MDLLETISTYGKTGRVTLIKIVTHSQHHPKLSTIHVHWLGNLNILKTILHQNGLHKESTEQESRD